MSNVYIYLIIVYVMRRNMVKTFDYLYLNSDINLPTFESFRMNLHINFSWNLFSARYMDNSIDEKKKTSRYNAYILV